MFFTMGSFALAITLTVIVAGTALGGLMLGRRLHSRMIASKESLGVVQGTLLGFLGLLLAFGLTMAVGRYENRRALIVQEANDIGTTYLRAQLLAEPTRSDALRALTDYADAAVALADQVPSSDQFDAQRATIQGLQGELWSLAGDAVRDDPVGSAPRLFVETLNPMIDSHSQRVASLRDRVPVTVMALQVFGSALALGVLAGYLALLGRGVVMPLAAAALVILILFISFDLDRPERGMIQVPDTALVEVRASMDAPPASTRP